MSINRRGKEEDGNYFYRFSYRKRDYCEGGFRTSAQANEAERLAKNKAIAQALHPDDYAGEMTFRQAGEWWLKEYAPLKRSRKLDFCRMPLAMDYFDKKILKDITPNDIDGFLSKLSELREREISDHTRNHYRAMIHALYERLRHKRMYKGENPTEFVDKIDVATVRCRFIYPAEERILTPAVAMEPDLFAYYLVGMMLGMRIGEVMKTRVKHVDLTMKHLFVPGPASKNKRSRYVPFDEEKRDPGHIIFSLFKGLMAGKDPEDYLMPHWGYTYLLSHFKAIAKALDIKGLTIHVWRHTFAYNLLSQGESIYKVSKLMGHSSIAVTEKHYGHLAQKDLRDVVDDARPFLSCNRIATDIPNAQQEESLFYPINR